MRTLATAALLASLTTAASGQTIVDPRLAPVDDWLEANPQFFPNGVALVILQRGEPIFRKTYHGFDESLAIPIASSTKWISGLGIAEAIVAGESGLSTQTRISEFVPSFFESVGPDGLPDKRDITLAQAFSHTSGLPFGADVNYHWDWTTTHEQAVDAIATESLIGPVGGQIHYGGFGMHAAGLAVAAALESDWAGYMSAAIFDPLGMTSTDYDAFTAKKLVPTQNPNVAGGIRTTLDDYTSFLSMLNRGGILNGERVVDAAAIDLLLTDYAGPEAPIDRSPYVNYESFVPGIGAFRTGFGCFIDPQRLDHRGNARWATAAGLYGTNAFIDLDRRITGVLFTYNEQRWPVPDAPTQRYNPSTRAFVQYVRPLIEAGLPAFCSPADRVGPGVVGGADLAAVIAGWGQAGQDVTGDGVVTAEDLAAVLAAWGPCP